MRVAFGGGTSVTGAGSGRRKCTVSTAVSFSGIGGRLGSAQNAAEPRGAMVSRENQTAPAAESPFLRKNRNGFVRTVVRQHSCTRTKPALRRSRPKPGRGLSTVITPATAEIRMDNGGIGPSVQSSMDARARSSRRANVVARNFLRTYSMRVITATVKLRNFAAGHVRYVRTRKRIRGDNGARKGRTGKGVEERNAAMSWYGAQTIRHASVRQNRTYLNTASSWRKCSAAICFLTRTCITRTVSGTTIAKRIWSCGARLSLAANGLTKSSIARRVPALSDCWSPR